MNNWFEDWFNSYYYNIVYNHRNIEEARKLIDLLVQASNIPVNSLVLDAACGNGRHSLILAEKGFRVVGFDLSKFLINNAKKMLEKNKIVPSLIIADMREIFFEMSFKAVFNLFTSFGYFNTDEENFAFVENSFNFIERNGWFFFDYFNSNFVKKNLKPFTQRKANNLIITERRFIKNKRVIKEISIDEKGNTRKFLESVALYEPDEILKKFYEIGFELFKLFGNYEGGIFEENNSERLVAIFKKR